MDPERPPSTPRKVKFAPRGPQRRTSKPVIAKTETAEEEDDGLDEAQYEVLSNRVKEHLSRSRPKEEKKSSVQVAFQHSTASTTIKSFSKTRQRTDDRRVATPAKESAIDDTRDIVIATSTAGTDEDGKTADLNSALVVKEKREYQEPWDYHHSAYPITLPLRRPYSGDPEILDQAEFENAAEYDESTLCSARELGLLDEANAPHMLFFQLPSNLPIGRQPTRNSRRETADNLRTPEKSVTNQEERASTGLSFGTSSAASKGKEIASGVQISSGPSTSTKGKEIAGSSKTLMGKQPLKGGGTLEELPEGYMGKLLVYKSGKVKLKLGDILYDVSPGSDCMFSQSVAAINTINNHCCDLGELNKRAVVSPDIDSLVDNLIDLG